MPSVTFELTVDVDEEMIDDDASVTDTAREILFSAPAFDGINSEVIDMLDVSSIVPEMVDPIEVGDVYTWDNGELVYVTAISVAEDGTTQVRVSDYYTGEAEDRTVTAGDIIEKVVSGELTPQED